MRSFVRLGIVFVCMTSTLTAVMPFFNRTGGSQPPKFPIVESAIAAPDASRMRIAGYQHAKPTGTLGVLVILMEYPDLGFMIESNQSDDWRRAFFEKVFFSESATAGNGVSVRDYYREVSYGKLNVDGIVVGPYTAQEGYKYYGSNDSAKAYRLTKEALDAFAENDSDRYDLASFDNNNDGNFDIVVVVHAGIGNEITSEQERDLYIHSHMSSIANYGVTSVSVTDSNGNVLRGNLYVSCPEVSDNGKLGYAMTNMTTIGAIAHELGHVIGVPDLYDTGNGLSYGVGVFDIMANGSYNARDRLLGIGSSPAHIDAYWKWQLGWIEPRQIISPSDDLRVTITNFARTGDAVFLLPSDFKSHGELFLVENRVAYGFDRGLPGEGALIWHIDDKQVWSSGAYSEAWNTVQNNPNHKGLDIEEASGIQHLDDTDGRNIGDAADFWRDSLEGFSSPSTPSTMLYSGSFADVAVNNISAAGEQMHFVVRGAPAVSMVASPNIFVYGADASITFSIISSAAASSHIGDASVHIYSLSGKKVRRLTTPNENHAFEWDGLDERGVELPEGVYYCSLQSDFGVGYATRVFLTRRTTIRR